MEMEMDLEGKKALALHHHYTNGIIIIIYHKKTPGNCEYQSVQDENKIKPRTGGAQRDRTVLSNPIRIPSEWW